MKRTLRFIILLTFCCLSIRCNTCCQSDIIHLRQGKLHGTYNSLDSYWTYFGVPYAEFRGRFKEAGEPPLWSGVFNANRSQLSCTQYSSKKMTTIGDEDCLNLNIYTPTAPWNSGAKLLPVIFYLYGGGFYKGSNSIDMFDPKYLIKKDVVVVIINYRVGAFGFLCLKNENAPGNMGLKDQLAALKWVKNNIASFGGDPSSVTIFGQSTGASCTDYLVLTQSDKGLFSRAIIHSGTALTTQSYDPNPILTASQAAFHLGYNTMDPDELLKIFLSATADEIAKISYRDLNNNALGTYIFKPCMEDPKSSEKPFLTLSPRRLLKSVGDISNISVIVGYDSQEGIFWANNYDDNGLKMLDRDLSSVVPNTFKYKSPEDKVKLIDDIREFYFNNSSTNYYGLIDYFSDVIIASPSVATMDAYLRNPKITLYNFYFNYESLRNLRKLQTKFPDEPIGASHTDELFYLFDNIELQDTNSIPKDRYMINIMTDLWTEFAKTGVPFTDKGILWSRSVDMLKFLSIDEQIKEISLPNKDRIEFWKRSYEKYLEIN